MASLNGWRIGNAELWRTRSAQARRAARRRALEKGHADPIFQPFSKRLAPDFAEAVERFLAERKARP
jgi:hypothetical protein